MWERIEEYARGLGLQGCAAVPVHSGDTLLHAETRLSQWLADGRHGDMAWMARDPEKRADPQRVLRNAKTLISCTLNYYTPHAQTDDPLRGRISRYAWGEDYHDVMLPKLKRLAEFLKTLDPHAESLCYVDTGPVMEKPWAARAGLGWQGKHTNLIHPKHGSWFFIGEIVTTARCHPALRAQEDARVGCGTCSRCIDVCPTRAITAPYQVDARRCIAYLTIEHKGAIPEELRPLLGNHVYGCDLCQDVCPWNRFATPTPEPAFQPRSGNLNPELIPLLYMTDDEFRVRFKGSPIKRLKRARFLRNVAVVLGNSKDPAAIPALQHACNDPELLVRDHAEWALQQISGHRKMQK